MAAHLDQPFGSDDTDLPLLDYQSDFDRTLLELVGEQTYFMPPLDEASEAVWRRKYVVPVDEDDSDEHLDLWLAFEVVTSMLKCFVS